MVNNSDKSITMQYAFRLKKDFKKEIKVRFFVKMTFI